MKPGVKPQAVPLFNRESGQLEQETVFEAGSLQFLYADPLGQILERLLVSQPLFSRLYTRYKYPVQQHQQQIADFVARYGVDLSEAESTDFASFAAFFERRLKASARPIDPRPEHLVAVADARLLILNLQAGSLLPFKQHQLSLLEIVRNRALAQQFAQGVALVYRLAPMDYHRFCYPDAGSHGPHTHIRGRLHSVHPFSLRSGLAVFKENERQYTLLKTAHFGPVLQVDIGALLVGRIQQALPDGGNFAKGQEKGYFEWGGSTILQIFEPGRINWDPELLHWSTQGVETLVRYGSQIGKARLKQSKQEVLRDQDSPC